MKAVTIACSITDLDSRKLEGRGRGCQFNGRDIRELWPWELHYSRGQSRSALIRRRQSCGVSQTGGRVLGRLKGGSQLGQCSVGCTKTGSETTVGVISKITRLTFQGQMSETNLGGKSCWYGENYLRNIVVTWKVVWPIRVKSQQLTCCFCSCFGGIILSQQTGSPLTQHEEYGPRFACPHPQSKQPEQQHRFLPLQVLLNFEELRTRWHVCTCSQIRITGLRVELEHIYLRWNSLGVPLCPPLNSLLRIYVCHSSGWKTDKKVGSEEDHKNPERFCWVWASILPQQIKAGEVIILKDVWCSDTW